MENVTNAKSENIRVEPAPYSGENTNNEKGLANYNLNSYPMSMSSAHTQPACKHMPSFIYFSCPPSVHSSVYLLVFHSPYSAAAVSCFFSLPSIINPTLLKQITDIVRFMYLTS